MSCRRKPSPVRMLFDERLELGNERRMTPACEVGVDSGLDRRQAQLVETSDLGLRERLVGEVRERRPSPERERLAEGARGTLGVSGYAPAAPPLRRDGRSDRESIASCERSRT